MFLLVLGHPYSLCGLPPLGLGHHIEFGAKEVVQQGRLARRLRAKDGNKVIVEASLCDLGKLEICIKMRTGQLYVSRARLARRLMD